MRRRREVKRLIQERRARFEPLARYNAEVSRGILHTPEYRESMRVLQQEFDEASGPRIGHYNRDEWRVEP